ncbi:pyridoxine/pyridoxamine 5'-phosphate oxidase [Ornithinibacillus bavariensis]|uniref:Pyridoxamine 5'-phosphate oxidase n=1 Tax=Ornithinibacillus bavariensis TaxID=545502 RepID=A0A919X5Y1_9BACI|nr:pyridoxamine 5'-phosphate oxidase family protein [Ornithinibacillus bavariensis]GIO26522.1 pyridoxamine 5'-phosphate oxidase [Ornithinibacillus bavariensis]
MNSPHKLLSNLKALEGPFPKFDYTNVPESPHKLFQEWFQIAIKNGVHEPHSMTLSPINRFGNPDARVLILKDMDEEGWYFASGINSAKGQQLKENPNVTLTFYWSLIGRQVRIRGTASEIGKEQSAKDFLGRGETARAIALIGKQSEVMPSNDDFERSFLENYQLVENNPNLVDPNWCLYQVTACEV